VEDDRSDLTRVVSPEVNSGGILDSPGMWDGSFPAGEGVPSKKEKTRTEE
jgi:hypothetical protein